MKTEPCLAPEWVAALMHVDAFREWYNGRRRDARFCEQGSIPGVFWAAHPNSRGWGFVEDGPEALALEVAGWAVSTRGISVALPEPFLSERGLLPKAP